MIEFGAKGSDAPQRGAPRRGFRAAAIRVAPFFLVGPISGPLLAGVVLNLRDGHRVLAGLYAIALLEYVVLLPLLVLKLGLDLQ